jgi:hypothetical protein
MRAIAALAAILTTAVARSVELPLTATSVLRFADVREGIEALTRRDDYILQMSPFDRQVRLKTDREVSEPELLAFMASHVVAWSPAEIAQLTPLVESLAKKLAPWKLKLPPVVLLVKTDGREEGGAAYCRGPAIVLSQNMLAGGAATLERVLPHEVFHVLSSHNPPLREALYEIIGFKPCNEVPLPPGLAARKITNPDAPVNNHFVTVVEGGRTWEMMPILFAKSERYDPARGGSLFQYLDFKLLGLENDGRGRRAALVDGKAVLFEPARVAGFGEQIGRNTTYTIHPEEVLADNFVFLINGRIDLPSPRVVEAMGKVLQGEQP